MFVKLYLCSPRSFRAGCFRRGRGTVLHGGSGRAISCKFRPGLAHFFRCCNPHLPQDPVPGVNETGLPSSCNEQHHTWDDLKYAAGLRWIGSTAAVGVVRQPQGTTMQNLRARRQAKNLPSEWRLPVGRERPLSIVPTPQLCTPCAKNPSCFPEEKNGQTRSFTASVPLSSPRLRERDLISKDKSFCRLHAINGGRNLKGLLLPCIYGFVDQAGF